MILVIIGISIVVIFFGIFLYWHLDCDMIGCMLAAIGFLALIISLITLTCLCEDVSHMAVIDDKIAMYQKENTKIEEQIAETVKQYQKYETDIFTEVSPDSSITLVALYPELKSDTLVQSQIEVYIKNNEEIKNLKTTKINEPISRWWLYFGGQSE